MKDQDSSTPAQAIEQIFDERYPTMHAAQRREALQWFEDGFKVGGAENAALREALMEAVMWYTSTDGTQPDEEKELWDRITALLNSNTKKE